MGVRAAVGSEIIGSLCRECLTEAQHECSQQVFGLVALSDWKFQHESGQLCFLEPVLRRLNRRPGFAAEMQAERHSTTLASRIVLLTNRPLDGLNNHGKALRRRPLGGSKK